MRHGTEAQESAPNPGKAVRGQAKTTATAPFSLPAGAVPAGPQAGACPGAGSIPAGRAPTTAASAGAKPSLLDWLREKAPDCGDNSCLFGGRGKGGMRTNGGCRCFKDVRPDMRRIFIERMWQAVSSMPSATAATSGDAEYYARVLWALTKKLDMGELSDYDDELASDVKEARAKPHLLLFGVPHSSDSGKADK